MTDAKEPTVDEALIFVGTSRTLDASEVWPAAYVLAQEVRRLRDLVTSVVALNVQLRSRCNASEPNRFCIRCGRRYATDADDTVHICRACLAAEVEQLDRRLGMRWVKAKGSER